MSCTIPTQEPLSFSLVLLPRSFVRKYFILIHYGERRVSAYQYLRYIGCKRTVATLISYVNQYDQQLLLLGRDNSDIRSYRKEQLSPHESHKRMPFIALCCSTLTSELTDIKNRYFSGCQTHAFAQNVRVIFSEPRCAESRVIKRLGYKQML